MQRTELNKNVTWLKIHGGENPYMGNRRHDQAHLFYMPEIGQRMSLHGREGVLDSRGIVTTYVTGVEQLSHGLLVRTLNSIYYIAFED